MAASQTMTYLGNCHCGRYRFSVAVPDIANVVSCACGVCKKKGSIWLLPPAGSFHVVRDDGHLTECQSDSLRDKAGCPFLFSRSACSHQLVLQLLWDAGGRRTSEWSAVWPLSCQRPGDTRSPCQSFRNRVCSLCVESSKGLMASDRARK